MRFKLLRRWSEGLKNQRTELEKELGTRAKKRLESRERQLRSPTRERKEEKRCSRGDHDAARPGWGPRTF